MELPEGVHADDRRQPDPPHEERAWREKHLLEPPHRQITTENIGSPTMWNSTKKAKVHLLKPMDRTKLPEGVHAEACRQPDQPQDDRARREQYILKLAHYPILDKNPEKADGANSGSGSYLQSRRGKTEPPGPGPPTHGTQDRGKPQPPHPPPTEQYLQERPHYRILDKNTEASPEPGYRGPWRDEASKEDEESKTRSGVKPVEGEATARSSRGSLPTT